MGVNGIIVHISWNQDVVGVGNKRIGKVHTFDGTRIRRTRLLTQPPENWMMTGITDAPVVGKPISELVHARQKIIEAVSANDVTPLVALPLDSVEGATVTRNLDLVEQDVARLCR